VKSEGASTRAASGNSFLTFFALFYVSILPSCFARNESDTTVPTALCSVNFNLLDYFVNLKSKLLAFLISASSIRTIHPQNGNSQWGLKIMQNDVKIYQTQIISRNRIDFASWENSQEYSTHSKKDEDCQFYLKMYSTSNLNLFSYLERLFRVDVWEVVSFDNIYKAVLENLCVALLFVYPLCLFKYCVSSIFRKDERASQAFCWSKRSHKIQIT
jgi:hypothetical protein